MAISNQQLIKTLEQYGFEEADGTILPRLILSICGREKQGKTHFALTAPGPLAIFSADIGLEGVLSKFVDKKLILPRRVTVPGDWETAKSEWEKLVTAWRAVLRQDGIRTVVADTATDLWELIRMARFGQLAQVLPYQYGPVNAEFRSLLKEAYDSQKNVLLLHKMKPLYLNDKRTADYERSGFSDMGFLVQANCVVEREPYAIDEDTGRVTQGEWLIHINDCRQNPDMAGETLSGMMCEFPFLAASILPDTEMEDWE